MLHLQLYNLQTRQALDNLGITTDRYVAVLLPLVEPALRKGSLRASEYFGTTNTIVLSLT